MRLRERLDRFARARDRARRAWRGTARARWRARLAERTQRGDERRDLAGRAFGAVALDLGREDLAHLADLGPATLGGPLRVVLEVVEVEERDVVRPRATPGSTSRGSATSRISSGRPLRHAITISIVARSTRTSGDAVEENSTSTSTSVSAMSASGTAWPPTCAASASARSACGSRRAGRRRRASATSTRGRDPCCPAPITSTRAPSSVAELLGRDRDRGRRDRHRMPADAGLGADALARLDRVPEQLRQELRRAALAHRGLPRVADLTEDLALADDHRVETGRDREEVGDRGFVVVGVEVVGEVVGVGAGVCREELGDVADRGVEVRAARVDLGAVARREHHDFEQVLTRGQVVQHLGQRDLRDRHPLEQLDRNGAVVQADDDERHVLKSSFASSMRPARTSSTMPDRNACCQSASSLERPEARSASRASESRSSRVAYSGPISSSSLRRRWAASAGLRPPVPIATHEIRTPDDRHQRKRAVGGIVGAVDPDPPLLRRCEHGPVDGRIVGGGQREPGTVEVGRFEALGRSPRSAPDRPSPAPRRRSPARPPSPRPHRRGAVRSCGPRCDRHPTTTTRRPRTSRFTG